MFRETQKIYKSIFFPIKGHEENEFSSILKLAPASLKILFFPELNPAEMSLTKKPIFFKTDYQRRAGLKKGGFRK